MQHKANDRYAKDNGRWLRWCPWCILNAIESVYWQWFAQRPAHFVQVEVGIRELTALQAGDIHQRLIPRWPASASNYRAGRHGTRRWPPRFMGACVWGPSPNGLWQSKLSYPINGTLYSTGTPHDTRRAGLFRNSWSCRHPRLWRSIHGQVRKRCKKPPSRQGMWLLKCRKQSTSSSSW